MAQSAAVQALRARRGAPARADPARPRPGLASRPRLRRLLRLPRPAGRPHGLRLRPHRRPLHHPLPRPLAGPGLAREHPREHASSRRRARRGSHRRGRRLHPARPRPARLPAGLDADAGPRPRRRRPGRADDDPAAAVPDRQGARAPHLPGGHGLRGGAHRGGRAGGPGRARLQGAVRGRALQARDRGLPPLARASRSSTSPRSRPRKVAVRHLARSSWASATSSATARPRSWSAAACSPGSS